MQIVAWSLAAVTVLLGVLVGAHQFKLWRLKKAAALAAPDVQQRWRVAFMTELLNIVGRDITRSTRSKKLRKRLDWDVGRFALVANYLEGRALVTRFTMWGDEPDGFSQFLGQVLGRGQRVRLTSSGLDEVDRPHIDPASPLQSIAGNLESIAPESSAVPKPHDVFISYAREDKDEVARPLAQALERRNLKIWYDEVELHIGENLRRKIDAGLVSSRFGVVVLSPHFFAKDWPQYELDSLVTRELAGDQQIVLPIWHRLTTTDVLDKSPSLANKVAMSTSSHSVDQIADAIASVVNSGAR